MVLDHISLWWKSSLWRIPIVLDVHNFEWKEIYNKFKEWWKEIASEEGIKRRLDHINRRPKEPKEGDDYNYKKSVEAKEGESTNEVATNDEKSVTNEEKQELK